MTEIALIAAVGRNNVIGKNNTIPWHCSEDLKYFKQTTLNSPIIMGRNTYESIGKPLPHRKNIILSRQSDYRIKDCTVVQTIKQALECAKGYNLQTNNDKIFIIGGEQIYRLAMPFATTLYITEIDITVDDATAYFPQWDHKQWTLQSPARSNSYLLSPNGLKYRFRQYCIINQPKL